MVTVARRSLYILRGDYIVASPNCCYVVYWQCNPMHFSSRAITADEIVWC